MRAEWTQISQRNQVLHHHQNHKPSRHLIDDGMIMHHQAVHIHRHHQALSAFSWCRIEI